MAKGLNTSIKKAETIKLDKKARFTYILITRDTLNIKIQVDEMYKDVKKITCKQ